MNVKHAALFELLHKSFHADIDGSMEDYRSYVDALGYITNKLHEGKVEVPHWRAYEEAQILKFILHSSSILQLIKGTPLKSVSTGEDVLVKDLSSILLLIRAQIENYLVLEYLTMQPKSDDEGELRFWFYELSGLAHRQKYIAREKEFIEKKAREKQQIAALILKILHSPLFPTLLPDLQKNLKSGKRLNKVLPSIESLIAGSSLATDLFQSSWKLYSNYAHSELLSSMQLNGYVMNPKEQSKMIFNAFQLSTMLVCKVIKDLVALFPTSEIVYNTLPETLTTKIDFWSKAVEQKSSTTVGAQGVEAV